jgi:two-component system response regulator AgrA
MLKVYIIEDDNNQRERLTNYIDKTIKNRNLDLEIALSTVNIKDFLCNAERKGQRGLYFLDIDLGEDVHGLELAELIRKHDPNGYIVFVTTHSELNIITFEYKVDAMDFIVKDDFRKMETRVEECLVKADEKEKASRKSEKDMYILDVGENSIRLKKENIIFFEKKAKSEKIILHCENRQIEFKGNIKEIKEKIGKKFFRLSYTSLINLDKVKNLSDDCKYILMKNGGTCKIGIGKKSNLLKLIKQI